MAHFIYKIIDHDAMRFYEKHQTYLRNDDLDYNVFSKHNIEKEKFLTVLYNLVLTMNDIYRKAPYYNFAKISKPLLECMNVILDEMDKYVNINRPDSNELTIINNELDVVSNESKLEVINYFNALNDDKDVVTDES